MCLLAVAFRAHADYPLVLIGNRDEFHARQASPACWWRSPPVLAGQDLAGGGTWLGLTRQGRLATITNYRNPGKHVGDAPTRGALVVHALSGDLHGFGQTLLRDGPSYNGFNLLWGDTRQFFYGHNQGDGGEVRQLEPGIYGLSNGLLDTPWPKLLRVRQGLGDCLQSALPLLTDDLFRVLADERRPPAAELPDTGIGREWELLLSAPFILSPDYGTRASTVVVVRRDGLATFHERTFDPRGGVLTDRAYSFPLDG